jgi:hypothetical protein
MTPDEQNTKSAQNYELLIRVDEQLKNLTREVREMGGSMSQRVALLDATKLSKEDATKSFNEVEKITHDHELRMRKVETSTDEIRTMIKTWGSIIGIALVVLEIVLKYL